MNLSPSSPAAVFTDPEQIEELLEEGFLKGAYGTWENMEGIRMRCWIVRGSPQYPSILISPAASDEPPTRINFSSSGELKAFLQENQIAIFGEIELEIILKDWPLPEEPLPTADIEKLLMGIGYSLKWDNLTQRGRKVWLDDLMGRCARVTYLHHTRSCVIAFNPARGDRQEFEALAKLLKPRFGIKEIRIEEF